MQASRTMPSIGIRMIRVNWNTGPLSHVDDVFDSIVALRDKEKSYRTKGFYYQSQQRVESTMSAKSFIDPICREKMVEWCYTLCDCVQFLCCREMVSVAFSYIDRYLDLCSCDHKSFKIASVTAFYMATKILSTGQMSIRSLVDLGRGEYDGDDIREMEKSFLDMLEWRMSPLTCQDFIRKLMIVLSDELAVESGLLDKVFYQSMYFAEISVYDHTIVGKDRYIIAVACLLCSIEELDCFEDIERFKLICAGLSVDLDRNELTQAKEQLWYLRSCSPQES